MGKGTEMFGKDKKPTLVVVNNEDEKAKEKAKKAEAYKLGLKKKDDEDIAKKEEELQVAEEADEKDRVAAQSFRPSGFIKSYSSGKFLCYGEFEAPLRFVESIRVGAVGYKPQLHCEMSMFGINPHASIFSSDYRTESWFRYVEVGRASIKITMASGQAHSIGCSRHELDILFDALVKAWKDGK